MTNCAVSTRCPLHHLVPIVPVNVVGPALHVHVQYDVSVKLARMRGHSGSLRARIYSSSGAQPLDGITSAERLSLFAYIRAQRCKLPRVSALVVVISVPLGFPLFGSNPGGLSPITDFTFNL